jgi:hypothetical protein
MENKISEIVMTMYWGRSQSMCSEFGSVTVDRRTLGSSFPGLTVMVKM